MSPNDIADALDMQVRTFKLSGRNDFTVSLMEQAANALRVTTSADDVRDAFYVLGYSNPGSLFVFPDKSCSDAFFCGQADRQNQKSSRLPFDANLYDLSSGERKADPIVDPEEEPQWIVNSLGELGVAVNGRFFFLYKGENIEYGDGEGSSSNGVALHDDGTPMRYRIVGKCEFGEVCHPVTCMKAKGGVIYDETPVPYTSELVFTPGLSFGNPEDGEWRPLPAAMSQQAKEV